MLRGLLQSRPRLLVRVPEAGAQREQAAADAPQPLDHLTQEDDPEQDVEELGQVVHHEERGRAHELLQAEAGGRDEEPEEARDGDDRPPNLRHLRQPRRHLQVLALDEQDERDERQGEQVVVEGHGELAHLLEVRVHVEHPLHKHAVRHLPAHVEQDPEEPDPGEVDGAPAVHDGADDDEHLGEHDADVDDDATDEVLDGRGEDRPDVAEDEHRRDPGVHKALQRREEHQGEDARDGQPLLRSFHLERLHLRATVRHLQEQQRAERLDDDQRARQRQRTHGLLVAQHHTNRREAELQQRRHELHVPLTREAAGAAFRGGRRGVVPFRDIHRGHGCNRWSLGTPQ
eukprot:CAMPEP_0174830190 /NCGR_PEP_ID=MMETSP1114-20130205/2386_1 /TAXON_ID=312471 /ORGANISM="Neobodo designis, Strain CCAP 1951/1" /LENGTH=343 /DNA_ID=CAMNT_0016063977 /DNA_START=70 /DNA_END=1101 /DNA_ORIENTATION=-